MTSDVDDDPIAVELRAVRTNGITLNVAVAGDHLDRPTILLVHGWPHTWQVWSTVMSTLASTHCVLAPDLRGIGGSERADRGYDAATIAEDLRGLLDAHEVSSASVMAIDAGVPAAFLLAMAAPDQVSELVLMESLLGPLPGAEDFLKHGPPWWFGFHSVPGLAETIVAGHEAEYLDFFLRSGTADGRGIPSDVRDAFVAAYTGAEALRGGFEIYRALAETGRQIVEATAAARLSVPTLAIGAGSVGGALHRQLEAVADDLTGVLIPNCGHIVPLDRPAALLDALATWRSERTHAASGR